MPFSKNSRTDIESVKTMMVWVFDGKTYSSDGTKLLSRYQKMSFPPRPDK
uniref:Uncharacterized protein n=1 Tax=Arion vulgaris TaxID=1028688 RepID=A0A0B6Z9U1_9EUPU